MTTTDDTQAEQPLTYEPEPEAAAETDDAAEPEAQPTPVVHRVLPDAQKGGAPPWAVIPQGLLFPRNRMSLFFRIPSNWTYSPTVGIPLRVETPLDVAEAGEGGLWRQFIVWPLSGGDQKLALGRAMQDPNRYAVELTKQMIRAVDGEVVDWSGVGGASINEVWEQIGGPSQNLLNRLWSQMHVLQKERLTRFFENYIALRA